MFILTAMADCDENHAGWFRSSDQAIRSSRHEPLVFTVASAATSAPAACESDPDSHISRPPQRRFLRGAVWSAAAACVLTAGLLKVIGPSKIGAFAASDAAAAPESVLSAAGPAGSLSGAAVPDTSEPSGVVEPQSEPPLPDSSNAVEGLAEAPALSGVLWVLVPHPDDEAQAWSLVERTPDVHKVFVVLTRGEQSAYCDEPAWDVGTGELRPVPWPLGRWSPECEQARIGAFFGFMGQIGAHDDGLPTEYESLGVMGPFPAPQTAVCRHDSLPLDIQAPDSASAGSGCIADRTALAWTSRLATVIWFNLGDGDLTDTEAVWATRVALEEREAFGLDPALPDIGIVGASFWNGAGHHDCDDYAHPDHGAVQTALMVTHFGAGWQAAASCASDPRATLEATVSHDGFLDVFASVSGTRIGAHPVNYGWLSDALPHGHHPSDYHEQHANFHRHQHFWVKADSQD